jgi:hypothetical protein
VVALSTPQFADQLIDGAGVGQAARAHGRRIGDSSTTAGATRAPETAPAGGAAATPPLIFLLLVAVTIRRRGGGREVRLSALQRAGATRQRNGCKWRLRSRCSGAARGGGRHGG